MSGAKIIHAIEVNLGEGLDLEDRAELGLYTVDDITYIRWTEFPLVGVDDDWAYGIIAEGGLGAEEAGSDLRRGGAPVSYTGYSIVTQSTYQNYLRFKSLGIELVGKTIKRWEFIGDDSDSDSTSKTLFSTLIIQDSSWNEKQWIIQVVNATYTQNAFMGTTINNDPDTGNFKNAKDELNGKIVPLTFGAFKVINDNPVCAKFVRTANKETAVVNTDLIATVTPAAQTIFPIIACTDSLNYDIRLGLTGATSSSISVVGMWLKIIEGGSSDNTSLVGKYKKITDETINYTGQYISVTLASYFEKDLSGNATADATNQAWVSIVDLKYEFTGDIWPLKGFFDNEGNLLSAGVRLYSYISKDVQKSYERTKIYDASHNEVGYSKLKKDGFRPVAIYGYEVYNDGNNNLLTINALLVDDDPDKLYSFDIFPLLSSSFQRYIAADLSAYGEPTFEPLQLSAQDTNVYVTTAGLSYATLLSYAVTGANGLIFDKDDSTYQEHLYSVRIAAGAEMESIAVFDVEIDFTKVLFDYDNYYLGLNIHTIGDKSYSHAGLQFKFRKFLGPNTSVLNPAYGYKYLDAETGGDIVDLPDFYYLVRTPDYNYSFVRIPDWSMGQNTIRQFIGFNTYPLTGINSLDKLKSIYKIGILISNVSVNSGINIDYTQTNQFKELAIICQSTDNISSEVFALCSGRIYNDTWGSRRTAANQIVTPADIIEHCKRLSNWGGDVEYGKAYDPNALIKTSAEGSFDAISLMPSTITTYPGYYKPTFQVENDSEAWTAEIEKKICATYNLCTYYDADGTACIKSLAKESPSETINFEDLVGEPSDIQPAQVQDVFCQPIVNYQYNYGSNGFDKQLAITNVQAASYVAGYAVGFATADGEAIWNKAHALYLKYGQIEAPPSDFTDQKTITTYEEALAWFTMKIDWMGKYRVTVPVFWDKGKNYHYAQHINFRHPHYTNGVSVECVIEKIVKDKNFKPAGKVTVSLVIIDDINCMFYYPNYQDHYDGEGTTPLVEQDHYDGEGTTPLIKQDQF